MAMMLSTSPIVSTRCNDLQKPVIACLPSSTSAKKEMLTRPQFSVAALAREDESTDVGSSLSDMDAVSSSCLTTPHCTDNETKSIDREGRSQKHRLTIRARQILNKQKLKYTGSSLETIIGTPVANADHGPLFFTPPPCLDEKMAPQSRLIEEKYTQKGKDEQTTIFATECTHGSTCRAQAMKKTDDAKGKQSTVIFATECPDGSTRKAQPTKKTGVKGKDVPTVIFATECTNGSSCKAQPMKRIIGVAGPPGLMSPVRRRRSRASFAQSMLSTAPPSGAVEPCSPFRRARLSTMEKARRNGVPLKVQPQCAYGSGTITLTPDLPAKKRLPFFGGSKAMEDSLRKVKPGVPVKKRVNAWLLEDPFPVFAEYSCSNHPNMPR